MRLSQKGTQHICKKRFSKMLIFLLQLKRFATCHLIANCASKIFLNIDTRVTLICFLRNILIYKY